MLVVVKQTKQMRDNSAKLARGLRTIVVHFLGSAEFIVILRRLRSTVAAFGDRAKCSDLIRKVLIEASCFENRGKALKAFCRAHGEIPYKYECNWCYNLLRGLYHLSRDCTAGCAEIRTLDSGRASGYVKSRKQLKVSIISFARSSYKSEPSVTSCSSSVLFSLLRDVAVFNTGSFKKSFTTLKAYINFGYFVIRLYTTRIKCIITLLSLHVSGL
jgi:hypothetical protein